MTDRDILRRARDDPRAFGALFDRHARTIHRYVTRRTGTSVADDVVAETFLIAFERRDAFDASRESALPWLFGIATNLVRRHHRAERRALSAIAAAADPELRDDGLGELAGRIDARRAVARLAKTIRSMPAIDRDTLLLFAWADLSYEQIAEAMAVPVGTVRSRLHRARRRLRADATTEEEGGLDGRPDVAAPAR